MDGCGSHRLPNGRQALARTRRSIAAPTLRHPRVRRCVRIAPGRREDSLLSLTLLRAASLTRAPAPTAHTETAMVPLVCFTRSFVRSFDDDEVSRAFV